MNCERCKKSHATLHVAVIENGVQQEAHLCESCARKSGVNPINFTIQDLLGSAKPSRREPRSRRPIMQCPGCGMTIAQVKNIARLGCVKCYEVFAQDVGEFVESYHKADQHHGKVPGTIASREKREAELARLKSYLDVVVGREDYEEAASIRDRIKRLEESLRGVEG